MFSFGPRTHEHATRSIAGEKIAIALTDPDFGEQTAQSGENADFNN
jgi:hypothetical protein